MPWARFQLYNVLGGGVWVALFLCGGVLFGNLPLGKNHFGLVTLLIIVVSLLPLLWALWQGRSPPAPRRWWPHPRPRTPHPPARAGAAAACPTPPTPTSACV